MSEVETVPLDLLDRKTVRTRARNVAIAGGIVAIAFGVALVVLLLSR